MDEFRARALHRADIPDGDTYYCFESRGHYFAGPAPETTLGTRHLHRHYGPDERLPSLFLRRLVYGAELVPLGRPPL